MYRFFEVFKTLKLPEDLAVYFENVEVTKVSKTSTNSLARVYIKSDRVIEKPIIFKVEDALKKQIFRISNMDVRIIDRYVLSAQYTPQTEWIYIMTVSLQSWRNTGHLNIIF